MARKSIGILGCGTIGQALLRAAEAGSLGATISGVTSRSQERAHAFLSTMQAPPPYLERAELIAESDLVIETAGGHVVPDLARDTFAAGKDLMVISIGALLDHPDIIDRSRATGCHLHAPSGAIAGLDGIKSACIGEVTSVMMESRKPPRALEGAPFLVENGISLDGLDQEMELLTGTARDACIGFPANLNVSAAVSLAGLGPDRTLIKVIAVPGLQRNCHDIEVEGEFGLLRMHIENEPSENPKTGRLTAMSIIRSVQNVTDTVHIGT